MIKEMEEDDVWQIKAIFSSYPHHFNKLGLIELEEEMLECLSNLDYSKRAFFVKKEKNQVLGAISYLRNQKNPYEFEIKWLAVRQDVKRQGIGKSLLLYLEEKIRALGGEILIVYVPDEIGSRTFYEKMGFTENKEISSFNKIGYKKIIKKAIKPTFKPREAIGYYE